MAVKSYRPTTPGRRGASVVRRPDLAEPLKALRKGKALRAGRAHSGRITVRHRGGAVKRRIRDIDFAQNKEVPAVVEHLAHDPFRSAFIALLKYADGERRYVLAEEQQRTGAKVETGAKAAVRRGNRLPLGKIPAGTTIFNIQLYEGAESSLVRAAGSTATVVSQETRLTQVRLPSGEVRRISSNCLATIGMVSNRERENITIGKAGRNRRLGIRPHVRGKAMNPADHPHGGGEGGSPIGLKGPKTPSGLYTLGRKTRRKRKPRGGVVRAR